MKLWALITLMGLTLGAGCATSAGPGRTSRLDAQVAGSEEILAQGREVVAYLAIGGVT